MSARTVERPTTIRREIATGRPLLTLPEAARALGRDEGTFRNLAKAGGVPTVRLGSRLYVPAAEIDKMLAPQSGA